MSRETSPVRPKSRSFDVIAELGAIKGYLEHLVKNTNTLETTVDESLTETLAAIQAIPPNTTMAAKNNLSFAGRSNETVDDLITQLQYLQLANNWTNDQLMGQALVTLHGDALAWYQSTDEAEFYAEGGNKPVFNVFARKLKEHYKPDIKESDILCDILSTKQTRGQSVDDYLAVIMPKFSKLKSLTEDMKSSILVQGFLPVIRDQLVLKDLKTFQDVELWARRLEKMSFVHKTTSVLSVEVEEQSLRKEGGEEMVATAYAQGGFDKSNQGITQRKKQTFEQNVTRTIPNKQYPGYRQRQRRISCFGCGGPHFLRECPWQLNYQKQGYRQNFQRPRRGNQGYRKQNTSYNPSRPQCAKCKRFGHQTEKCYQRPNMQRNMQDRSKKPSYLN